MKKILSLALALVLALGAFAVFADDVDKTDVANQLRDWKVLKGNETGDLMLDKNLNRQDAIIVLERMMGVEAEAAADTLTPSFDDIANPFYNPYIAYAERKGWTNGIGGKKFGYGQEVTVKEFSAFMLRALEYTETPYEETMKKAEELGLLKGVESLEADKALVRGDAFVVMFNTLNTKPKDNKNMLKNVLGIVEMDPVAKIEKVEADNLKQIKVYLTAPIEDAGDESNWSLKTDNAKLSEEDSDYVLSEDGMMVTITLKEQADQQDDFTLTCKDLLEDKKVKVEGSFLDDTVPTIESAEVLGIRTIKVVFSEPMTEKSMFKSANYEVKKEGKSRIYVTKVEEQKNGTEALVTLGSDLKDGDITVQVKKVKDYAGFTAPKKSFDLTVVKDEEAPVVVGYKDASPYEITLVWSEDIRINKKDFANYYHTNTNKGNRVVLAPEVDGNELTLKFWSKDDTKASNSHLMPSGIAHVYVKDDAVKDYWNNKNDKQSVKVDVTQDTEAPEIVELKKIKKQSKITLEFNEKVYLDDEEFKLLKSNGKEKDLDIDVTGKGTKELTFDFGTDLKPGNYTLVLEGIEDRAGNDMAKTEFDFEMVDKSKPDFEEFKVNAYDAGKDTQKLVITFAGEKMDEESVTDPDNYYLADTNTATEGKSLDDDDIVFDLVDNGETLVIEIDKKEADLNLSEYVGKYLYIGRLKDAAGNKMKEFAGYKKIENGDEQEISVLAETKSNKEIEVTVKDNVIGDLDVDKIKFYDKDNTLLQKGEVTTSLDDGDTILKITMEKKFSTDAGQVFFTIADKKFAQNEFGVYTKLYDKEKVTDGAGPVLKDEKKDITSHDQALFIEMSEALSTKYADFIVEDLVISYNGKTLKAQKDYQTEVMGDTIKVTFSDKKLEKMLAANARKVKVKSVKEPKYIMDLAGNEAEGFDDYYSLYLKGDAVEPKPGEENPGEEEPTEPAGKDLDDEYVAYVKTTKIPGILATKVMRTKVVGAEDKVAKYVMMDSEGKLITIAKGSMLDEETAMMSASKAGDVVKVKMLDAEEKSLGVVELTLKELK